MTRTAAELPAFRIFLATVLLLLLSDAARAADPIPQEDLRRQRAEEIISRIEKPQTHRNWFAAHLGVRKGAGIEYRHRLSLGQRDLVLSIYGPAVKKKGLGVGFEVRF